MSVLQRYFADSAQRQERLRATKASDSRLRVAVKNAVPVGLRGTARVAVTDTLRWRERRKAEEFAQSGPLFLHLGSGGEHKDGWVNIDLAGDPVDVAWNLAHPLPFAHGSVEAIFHEHLLEHIPLQAGASFMAECFRVLKPGGILRVAVPDAGKLARSYAGDRSYLEALHPGRPTAMLALQELFYWHRHTTMFDAETLLLLFCESGFTAPRETEFGVTDLGIAPDTESRRAESLYVEAVKD